MVILCCAVQYPIPNEGGSGPLASTQNLTTANIGIYFGKYINEKVNAGLGIGYILDESLNTSIDRFGNLIYSTRDQQFGLIEPFVNVHSPISNKLYFNSGISAALFRNLENSYTMFDQMVFAYQPGLYYFATDRLTLIANFGRIYYSTFNITSSSKSNTVGIDLSTETFSIGVQLLFGKKASEKTE